MTKRDDINAIIDDVEHIAHKHMGIYDTRRTDTGTSSGLLVDLVLLGVRLARKALAEGAFD